MASKQMLAVLAVFFSAAAAAAVLPSAMGTQFIVGDNMGWMQDFNYTAWAEGKEFRVGDHLVFDYKQGSHNVMPVGGDEFKACKSNNQTNAFTSGSDSILLKTAGKNWYICGFGDHCQRGQKLVINVQSAISLPPSSSPSPPPPATSAAGVRSYAYRMLLAAVATTTMMIVMA